MTETFIIGIFVGISKERKKAVQAEVVHWFIVDKETGEKSFLYGRNLKND